MGPREPHRPWNEAGHLRPLCVLLKFRLRQPSPRLQPKLYWLHTYGPVSLPIFASSHQTRQRYPGSAEMVIFPSGHTHRRPATGHLFVQHVGTSFYVLQHRNAAKRAMMSRNKTHELELSEEELSCLRTFCPGVFDRVILDEVCLCP